MKYLIVITMLFGLFKTNTAEAQNCRKSEADASTGSAC